MQHVLYRIGLFFTGLILTSTAFAQTPQIIRGPYIQNLTSTSATICWHTDVPANSRLIFGIAVNQLNGAIFNNQPLTEHAVTVSNLKPATRYYYSFGHSGNRLQADSSQHFLTAPKSKLTKK